MVTSQTALRHHQQGLHSTWTAYSASYPDPHSGLCSPFYKSQISFSNRTWTSLSVFPVWPHGLQPSSCLFLRFVSLTGILGWMTELVLVCWDSQSKGFHFKILVTAWLQIFLNKALISTCKHFCAERSKCFCVFPGKILLLGYMKTPGRALKQGLPC